MKPSILISSCILGNNVRYDGGNKLDQWVAVDMAKFFDFKSVCPEVMMGMSIPREPVNLVKKNPDDIRMVSIKTKIDHTENALNVANNIVQTEMDICGAILQKKSPSCGVERVKLYNEKDELLITEKNSPLHRGLFAKTLIEKRPMLPVIDSGRLHDKHERDNFLRRVMAYHRFYQLDGSIKQLQDFHARYKFVIMEHSQDKMRILGKIAANSNHLNITDVYLEYSHLLFETLKTIPTRKSCTNVFFHLIGFFKNELDSHEKMIIHQMISDYHREILPYIVPHKMLDYLINKHQQYYLKNHYYLDQFPRELRTN